GCAVLECLDVVRVLCRCDRDRGGVVLRRGGRGDDRGGGRGLVVVEGQRVGGRAGVAGGVGGLGGEAVVGAVGQRDVEDAPGAGAVGKGVVEGRSGVVEAG